MPISLDIMPAFKVLITTTHPELTREPELTKKPKPENTEERKTSSLFSATNPLNKNNIIGIGIGLEKLEFVGYKSTPCFVIIKNEKFIVTASELELSAIKGLPKALKDAYVVCKILMDLLYYSPRLEGLDDYFITKILPSSYELKNIVFQLSYEVQALTKRNDHTKPICFSDLLLDTCILPSTQPKKIHLIFTETPPSSGDNCITPSKDHPKLTKNPPDDAFISSYTQSNKEHLLKPTGSPKVGNSTTKAYSQPSNEHIKLVHTYAVKILEKLNLSNYEHVGRGNASFSKQNRPHDDPQNTIDIGYYKCPKFFLSEKYAMIIRVYEIHGLELRNNLRQLLS